MDITQMFMFQKGLKEKTENTEKLICHPVSLVTRNYIVKLILIYFPYIFLSLLFISKGA